MKSFSEFLLEESIELDESRMSEVHASITNHLDKHIASFKKGKLGMDQFGTKVVAAHDKIAKQHGLEKKHAAKLVNDYVDSALKEEVELGESGRIEYSVGSDQFNKKYGFKSQPTQDKDGNKIISSSMDKSGKVTHFIAGGKKANMSEEVELDEGITSTIHKYLSKRAGKKADDAYDMGDEKEFQKQVDKSEYHRVKAGGKPTRINTNPDAKFITTREEVELDEAKKGVTDKKFGKPEPESKSGFKQGQRVAHYRGMGKTLHGDVVNPDVVSGGKKGAMVKFSHGNEFVPHSELKDAKQYWEDEDRAMRKERDKPKTK